MHPNDIRAAGEEHRAGLEGLGSGRGTLKCALCREIVERMDRFVTNPNFIENASLHNIHGGPSGCTLYVVDIKLRVAF